MSTAKLKFVDSPYFVPEEDNWRLKEGAPEDIKKEFEEYMKYTKDMQDKGVFI